MPPELDALRSALDGRYALERELGAGGMATVYLATDTRHGRSVAIKVLRAEIAAAVGRDRFLREIQIAAQLQHPNIVALIDSGEVVGALYYIMPYIAGESLRQRLVRDGRLPVTEAVRLASEIADALSLAHRREVVHRDIKPENILLQEGHALVADFGIARAVSDSANQRLTQTGFAMGTPAYMSPEQIDGAGEVDGRSDLYSLACVLFEMLSGAPPFRAQTAQGIFMKHLTEPAPDLSSTAAAVPAALASAVTRALAKDRDHRFPDAAAFSAALAGVPHTVAASSPATPVATLVVVPFENASPAAEDEFFAIGLTDEIISDLSKVKGVRVISRSSSMKLKGTPKDLRSIGRELNVRYALTGTVRRLGEALRITAELVDTTTDTSVWSSKYSGTVDDVFDMQEKLARQIVDALRVTVTPEESKQLAARDVTNVRVYERVVLARDLVYSYDAASLERAKVLLYQALADSGDDALVLSWLANAHYWSLLVGSASGPGALAMTDGFAQRAVQLDPDSAPSNSARALAEWMKHGARAAIPWHRRSVECERSADHLILLAYCLSLAGWSSEAVALSNEAVERDPLTPTWKFHRSWILMRVPDRERAIADARALIGTDYVLNTWVAGFTLCYCGQIAEGLKLLRALPSGDSAPFLFQFAHIIVRALTDGDTRPLTIDARATEWCNTGDPFAAVCLAGMSAHVGDRDRALHWMKFAIGRGVTDDRWWSELDPFMAPLRGDPEFQRLVASARLTRESEPL